MAQTREECQPQWYQGFCFTFVWNKKTKMTNFLLIWSSITRFAYSASRPLNYGTQTLQFLIMEVLTLCATRAASPLGVVALKIRTVHRSLSSPYQRQTWASLHEVWLKCRAALADAPLYNIILLRLERNLSMSFAFPSQIFDNFRILCTLYCN